MSERYWDPSAVEKANGEMTLWLEVPESIELENNPDGSRPSISLSVKSDNAARSLTALTTLRDNHFQNSVIEAAADHFYEIDEEFKNFADAIEAHEGDEPPLDLIDKLEARLYELLKIHRDWVDHSLEATLTDDSSESFDVSITMRAPGYSSMVSAYEAMTKPQKLSQIAANFMPLVGDDEEYFEEDDYNEDEED